VNNISSIHPQVFRGNTYGIEVNLVLKKRKDNTYRARTLAKQEVSCNPPRESVSFKSHIHEVLGSHLSHDIGYSDRYLCSFSVPPCKLWDSTSDRPQLLPFNMSSYQLWLYDPATISLSDLHTHARTHTHTHTKEEELQPAAGCKRYNLVPRLFS
jgi:hypothetical protein